MPSRADYEVSMVTPPLDLVSLRLRLLRRVSSADIAHCYLYFVCFYSHESLWGFDRLVQNAFHSSF